MAISPIGGAGSQAITPIEFPSVDKSTNGTGSTGKASFGDSLTNALDNLQGAQSKADDLSMQVATGKLTNIHDYMIAANQAEITTQLTVAVKNKAVDAFNQIMNMSV
jgi:flagellar hook-basal body complex protein FliE